VLKGALEEKHRALFDDSEMGFTGDYLYSCLVHGGDSKSMLALGCNNQAGEMFDIDFRGPIVVFRETESGKVGQLSIPKLESWRRKNCKNRVRQPSMTDLAETSGLSMENVFQVTLDEPIPDSKCEQCDDPGIYPVVEVGNFALHLKFCRAHHPKYQDEKKTAKPAEV